MMTAGNATQDMMDVLAIESKSVMSYIAASAWPQSIDKDDDAASQVFAEAWEREAPFVDRMVEMVSDVGGQPSLYGTYRFAPSRFNFARPSHLLSVVPALVQEEIGLLAQTRARAEDATELASTIDEILAVKADGLAKMKAAFAKQVAARAKAAEGAEAVSEAPAAENAADDGLGFRDADMEIADRLTKVEGKPLDVRLWAAMAQTDCTACGYDCEGYAKAIAAGEDSDLTKCVPGEDDTANALKQLMSA